MIAQAADVSRETLAGAKPAPHTDPFLVPAVRDYLAGQPGVTAAIYDRTTGDTWTFRPEQREVTASIMKVDILETLLAGRRDPLSGDALSEASRMIENSDNDDAQDLWDDVGSAVGVEAFDRRAGLTQTTPNSKGYWGVSRTSALDQVRLLRLLDHPGSLLSDTDRGQALSLMAGVEADQRWGVTAGPPPGAAVAVKNGWLPLRAGNGWQVNSDGVIRGSGFDVSMAILTRGSATESAGIAAIEHLSRLVWQVWRG
jgi:hypothetical protein